MFDINNGRKAQEREEKGIEIPFEDENGVVVPDTTLVIVGTLAPTYRRNLETMREQSRDEQREISEGEANAILAACAIKSWDGFLDGDAPFSHSLDNAVAFVTACPWMVAKIRLRSTRHASFFTQPSTGSLNRSGTTGISRPASKAQTGRNAPTSKSSPEKATRRPRRHSNQSETTRDGSSTSESGSSSSTAGAASE